MKNTNYYDGDLDGVYTWTGSNGPDSYTLVTYGGVVGAKDVWRSVQTYAWNSGYGQSDPGAIHAKEKCIELNNNLQDENGNILGGGFYDIISNREWMTIARNVEQVGSNWHLHDDLTNYGYSSNPSKNVHYIPTTSSQEYFPTQTYIADGYPSIRAPCLKAG